MRKFRIKLQPEIGERQFEGNDLPDILIQEDQFNGRHLNHYVKTDEVLYDQVTPLNSSYKNYVHVYKVAMVGKL